MKSIDQRLERCVAQFGNVPQAARRLKDYEARDHRDPWIQRLLGEGIVCAYVLVYQLDERWWTFCFDRRDRTNSGEETWIVEEYSSDGFSSRNTFLYEAASHQWRREGSRDRSSESWRNAKRGGPAGTTGRA